MAAEENAHVQYKIGESKFISYDIVRSIQKMGANVQEELTDMTHTFVNVCSP